MKKKQKATLPVSSDTDTSGWDKAIDDQPSTTITQRVDDQHYCLMQYHESAGAYCPGHSDEGKGPNIIPGMLNMYVDNFHIIYN